jgi:MoaA/NifB/PqqE/SkfB family radical SAM enzyme
MHIEPTSRCTLACPACPRTWFGEKFDQPFPKQDLDLDQFEKFLDCESGHSISNFTLNGNHGDPIYYPDLLNMIDRFRSRSFKISTNGSFQKPDFWHALAERLQPCDTVFFSIDGLEHNNHLYRRNSDWESIMQGLNIMVNSSARIIWKSLIFSYNVNDIEKIKALALSCGAEFVVESTSRFGDESLKPEEKLIDTSRLYKHNLDTIHLEPQCSTQEYVSADGFYWPCCLITSMFTLHKTTLWKQKSNWSISTQNLDQARMQLEQWKHGIIENPTNAHAVCKMNCKPGQKFPWMSV